MARKLKELLGNVEGVSSDQLANMLSTQEAPLRTDEQLRAEAERAVGSLYNQKELAAQQQHDRTTGALRSQLDALGTSYQRQAEQAQKATRLNLSAADHRALSRGMGRSSYNLATLGNIQSEGDRALGYIEEMRTNQESAINQQIAQRSEQLADILAAYRTDRETDILARMDELRAVDKKDAKAATEYNNSLILALADRLSQERDREREQANWERQFGESVRQYDQGYAFQQERAAAQDSQWAQQFAEQTRQYDQSFAQQTRQWEQQFNENVRQFNANLTEQQKARKQSQENWLKEFEESVRQNDTKLAEQIRQFNESLSLDEKRLALSNEQFQQSIKQFEESVRQADRTYGLQEREMTLKEKAQAYDEMVREREYERLYGNKSGYQGYVGSYSYSGGTKKNPPKDNPPDDNILNESLNVTLDKAKKQFGKEYSVGDLGALGNPDYIASQIRLFAKNKVAEQNKKPATLPTGYNTKTITLGR